jgi:hypothetical protein
MENMEILWRFYGENKIVILSSLAILEILEDFQEKTETMKG